MEQKALIKNKVTGQPYEVTRSQWATIQNSVMCTAFEMVKDFPPVVNLEDLPEVQEINSPTADAPEESAALPVEDAPNDPPAKQPPDKTSKKKNDRT